MVCGLFAHELGHCLYTDFLASQTYGQEISACRWYPEPPTLPTVKDRVNERALWDYAQAEPENLALLARVAHEVGNVLEDASIENRILEAFPGTLGQSLDFLREWQLPSSKSGRPRASRCSSAYCSSFCPMASSAS